MAMANVARHLTEFICATGQNVRILFPPLYIYIYIYEFSYFTGFD
jgi:hypothetical protein